MARLPSASVDLVFADPPFNVGFGYDVYHDRLPRPEYLAWSACWIKAAARLLKPTGSFFLAIGDESAAEMKCLLDAAGLSMRNWIIWHYTFGPHQTKKFGRDHAHILYYVADPKRFTFDADAIRIRSKRQECGDRRANPAGRVPGDVWDFARLPGNAKERTGHPCQMPEAVLARVVSAASRPGDVVFDPFAGSGTTLVVAKRLGRVGVGCELSPAYADAIDARLAAVHEPGGDE